MRAARGLWATALAPRWAVGAELARTLGALSLFTEAVRLFEELELWDEMVAGLIVRQRGWEAEDIVRRRRDDARAPRPEREGPEEQARRRDEIDNFRQVRDALQQQSPTQVAGRRRDATH